MGWCLCKTTYIQHMITSARLYINSQHFSKFSNTWEAHIKKPFIPSSTFHLHTLQSFDFALRVERGSVTFQGVFRTKVSLTSSLLILSLEPFKTPDSAPTPTGLRHRQPHQEHFCTRGKVLSVYAKQNPADYLCQCGFHSLGGSCGM